MSVGVPAKARRFILLARVRNLSFILAHLAYLSAGLYASWADPWPHAAA